MWLCAFVTVYLHMNHLCTLMKKEMKTKEIGSSEVCFIFQEVSFLATCHKRATLDLSLKIMLYMYMLFCLFSREL